METRTLGRREFLLRMAALSAAASAARRSQKPASGKSVIVVGAGVSGLAAAAELVASGCTVTVLEGRDRIGGRVWSADLAGQPVDLGAQWIEGTLGNPIVKLCRERGIQFVASNYKSVVAYDPEGRVLPEEELRRLLRIASDWLGRTRTLNRERTAAGEPDVTIADALRAVAPEEQLSDRERTIIDWAIRWRIDGDWGEDQERLSLRNHWAEDEEDSFGGSNCVLPGGYGQVPLALSQGLDVRLGQVVQAITSNAQGVEVVTEKETFRADRVVVTLPLGVLKAGSVRFEPALPPQKLEAIEKLGFGVAGKVVLRFERAFWPKDAHFLGQASAIRGQFMEWTNLAAYTPAPILSLWSAGDAARALEGRSDEEVVGAALAVVRKIFGADTPQPTAHLVTRWGADPLARGCYSHLPVGASYDHFDALAEPVGERLFFAGEATERTHMATVHGAYLSGLREGRRVAALGAR